MISDILQRMVNNPDFQFTDKEVLLKKRELISESVQKYYGNGLSQADIYQMLKGDINKYGPPVPTSELKRFISQQWSRCMLENNALAYRKSLYVGDPESHLTRYARETQSWGKVPVLRSGIDVLDQAIGGGLLPGQLMVITGGEGSMKTSLALKMVETFLEEVGEKILFFSLDMEAERVALRRLLPLLGMTYKDALLCMRRNTQDYQDALTARRKVDRGNLVIVDGPHDLKKIKLVISLENPSLVVIDYLTCIEGFRSELDCAREVIKEIRKLKREYGFTFVTLNQISQQSKIHQKQGIISPTALGGGSSQQAADLKIDLMKDTPCLTEEGASLSKPRIIATISKTRDSVAGRSFDLAYDGRTMNFIGEAREVFRVREPKTIFTDMELPL